MNVLALGFGNFGGPDVLIFFLIVLILVGANQLPDLTRGLGRSVNEFRRAREDIDRELQGAGVSSTSLSSFHTAMSTPFPLPAPGTAPKAGLLKVPPNQLRKVLGITTANYVETAHSLALIEAVDLNLHFRICSNETESCI